MQIYIVLTSSFSYLGYLLKNSDEKRKERKRKSEIERGE